MRVRLPAILLLLLILAPIGGAEEGQGDWPFGAPRGGLAARMGAKDLVNLGLLGAKARDADAPPPAERGAGGGRTSARMERSAKDEGPQRLLVEVLFPEGPAERAGLEVGDVIVGAGRAAKFKSGSFGPLADALLKAESSKGELTLYVQRGDETRATKLAVSIPVAGKIAAKPTEGAGRLALVRKALAWLAARQAGNGGYPETLSGANGAVVQASLAGLAWLAAGSNAERGPYSENVANAADFVIRNLGRTFAMPGMGEGSPGGRPSGLDQTNWGYAHGAIFLGELHARSPSPKVRAALMRCGEELAQRQEPSGGWAHGPGGPNPLGYTELNIVTGLALCGLGMAERAGYVVPAGVLDRAEAYLRASSSGDGGVGYSAQPGQKGMGNIGRTAAAFLGYLTLDLAKSAWAQKMRKYCERNSAKVMEGHASLMQHVLLAGVAAHAIGKSAKTAYWNAMRRDLVLARAPDGSFQPRPWHESTSIGSNSDVSFGEVWTTAAWTVVLACEPTKDGNPGLPVWMGLR